MAPPRGRLRLRISATLAEALVASEFGVWSPAATEMHTALRQPEDEFYRGRGREVVVRASPDAWDAMRRWCELHAYTDARDRFSEQVNTQMILRYQHRLRKELDKLAAHPGYRALAVPGTATTVLQGRRVEEGGRYWPTVRQALEAVEEPGELEVVELLPVPILRRRQAFTVWNPHPVS